jgi:uncharacterized radical SAM superfamily protein
MYQYLLDCYLRPLHIPLSTGLSVRTRNDAILVACHVVPEVLKHNIQTITPKTNPVTFDIMDDGRDILASDQTAFDGWLSSAFRSRHKHFDNKLYCYSPTGYPYKIRDHAHTNPYSFASLSVTGTSCSLHCEHCDGKLLKGMAATVTPDALYEACRQVKDRGGHGVLISGGSDSKGHVPLDRFTGIIRKVKNELGLMVVVHTGLVTAATAAELGSTGIDAAMLDIIGSRQVAKAIYHLEDGPAQMGASLDLLKAQGIPIAPHVLVGLDYSRYSGELEALHMIASRDVDAVVIIALSPLRGTAMAGVAPPSPDTIGRILTVARLGMEKTPLLLGCARPIGAHKAESDTYAIRSGVNGIAYVSQQGVDFARAEGLAPVFRDTCCSLAPMDLSAVTAE